MMKDRASLLREIDEVSFAINDLTLYLDTHPDCRDGLAAFHAALPKRESLLKEYAASFGPLTVDCIGKNASPADSFTWLDGPAPWEGGMF